MAVVVYNGTQYPRTVLDTYNMTLISRVNRDRVRIDSIPAIVQDEYHVNRYNDLICLEQDQYIFDIKNGITEWTPTHPRVLWSYDFSTSTFGDLISEKEKFVEVDGEYVLERIEDEDDTHYRVKTSCDLAPFYVHFLLQIIKERNPFFVDKMLKDNLTLGNQYVMLNNLIRLTDSQMADAAEKVISSLGKELFVRQIIDAPLELNIARKTRQIIQIPDKVLTFIKDKSPRNNMIPAFKTLCENDPNVGIFIVDYLCSLENIKGFRKFTLEEPDALNIGMNVVKILAEIKEKVKDIDIPKLLKYLIKQRVFYYWNEFQPVHSWGSSRTLMTTLFWPPESEAREYRDYINMMMRANQNLDAIDLFPHNLNYAHAIAARNVNILDNDFLRQSYCEAVKGLSAFEYTRGKFLMTYPKTINELVFEGNYLDHCVATYATDIAEKTTRVFCIRRVSEPNVPVATLELSNDNKIVQLKEAKDMDVTDPEIIAFAKAWRKEKVEK